MEFGQCLGQLLLFGQARASHRYPHAVSPIHMVWLKQSTCFDLFNQNVLHSITGIGLVCAVFQRERSHALHAEAELPDRPRITLLGVQSKRANRAAIACLEPPVVQHPQGRTLEQHVVGCRAMASVKPERQGLCSSVVCVLCVSSSFESGVLVPEFTLARKVWCAMGRR